MAGDGMLLSRLSRNACLTAKKNLVCGVEHFRPEEVIEQIRTNPIPDEE
jgi:hypothetical protein